MLDKSADEKEFRLRKEIGSYKKVIVAYSGGVDSTLVAKIASEELGRNALIAISASASLPENELQLAKSIACRHNFNLEIVLTKEMDDRNYTSNPIDRCYHCKKELYGFLFGLSLKKIPILDGTNFDDLKDERYGRKAASEFGVVSPLVNHEVTKKEARSIAKRLGLENWDKPQSACLSSRLPTGVEITRARLKMIEKAEAFLREFGLSQVRVRYHHEIARIEINMDESALLLNHNKEINELFLELGFKFVALDIVGYRQGSMLVKNNES